MKVRLLLIAVGMTALFYFGCSLPSLSQLTSSSTSTPTSTPAPTSTPTSTPTPSSQPPSGLAATGGSSTGTFQVTTNGTNTQGILITPSGSRLAIAAVGSDGTTVACASPLGVSRFGGSGSSSGGSGDSAVVVGTTSDGKPGVWIYASDKIEAPTGNSTGTASSILRESDAHNGVFRGRFGWTYHVMGKSSDGKIIIGYAVNKNGFRFGGYQIDPGTEIGVFWRVWKDAGHRHFLVSQAHIIGIFASPTISQGSSSQDRSSHEHGDNHGHGHRDHHHNQFEHHRGERFARWMDNLWVLLSGQLTSYLSMVDKDGISYDQTNNVYLISGTDQDGNPAVATLDPNGTVSSIGPPPQQQTQVDLAPGAITTTAAAVEVGKTFTVDFSVQNLDSGTVSGNFDVVFYAATSTTFDPATDSKAGTLTINGIGGSTSLPESATLTMPSVGSNSDVYIYADITDPNGVVNDVNTANNISTVAQAPIVLAYDASLQSYNVWVETYGTGGTTNTGIVLYKENATGTGVSYVASQFNFGANTYGSLNYTSTGVSPGLSSGTYYVAVIPLSSQYGAYAVSVRTENLAQASLAALTSEPTSSNDGTAANGMEIGSNYATYTTPIPTIAQVINVGQSLSWYIPSGDTTDWFTFTLP